MPITLFAARTPDAEDAGPPRDRVTDGDPRATVVSDYEGADGKMLAGIWTCTPGRWRVVYDETEYCRILSGHGALIDENGHHLAIAAGDEFVIDPGFTGEWLVSETMVKRYVVLLP